MMAICFMDDIPVPGESRLPLVAIRRSLFAVRYSHKKIRLTATIIAKSQGEEPKEICKQPKANREEPIAKSGSTATSRTRNPPDCC
jgi:hypothetical protein